MKCINSEMVNDKNRQAEQCCAEIEGKQENSIRYSVHAYSLLRVQNKN